MNKRNGSTHIGTVH